MAEEHGEAELAPIMYVSGVTPADNRFDYYDIYYVPDSWFDGVSNYVGGTPYNQYENIINTRLGLPSPLTLDVFGMVTEDGGNATATITLEEDIAASNVKVRFAVTEGPVVSGGTTYNHYLRAFTTAQSLTISSADEVETVSWDFNVNSNWNVENLKVFAFVQDDNTKEVYQAAYMSETGCVFEGTVTNSETGDPVPAKVWSDGPGFLTFADDQGYYNLSVSPGDHILKSEYFGYYEHTSAAMSINFDETVQYNITLTPLPTTSMQGVVSDCNDNPIPNATLTLLDVPVDPVQTDANGQYSFTIPGDYGYIVQVEAPEFDCYTFDLFVDPQGITQDITLYEYYSFESDDANFTHSVDQGPGNGDDWEWGQPTIDGGPSSTYDGSNAWGTGLTTAYTSQAVRSLYSEEYTLEGMDDGHAFLKFYYWMEAQKNGTTCWDGGNVQISVDGGDWEVIHPQEGYTSAAIIGLQGESGFGGETEGWVATEFDLTTYVGSDVKFRFKFGSTNNSNNRGWFIDHLAIYGADLPLSTGINDYATDSVPAHFSLSQNYPNPFNPKTTIHYTVPTNTTVDVSIYDVQGKLIKNLVTEPKLAGYHSVTWNGVDNSGEVVGSGVYLYRISAGDYIQTKQCLLIK